MDNYIYDVLLNFSDDGQYIDFFEWSKDDFFINFKKIPIIKISSEKMFDIIKNEIIIDKSFLEKIENRAVNYNNCLVKYCFLVTDLNRVLGLKCDNCGVVVGRSSLLLDEEDYIIEESTDLLLDDLNFELLGSLSDSLFLTRNEKFIKSFLLKEINTLYEKEKYDEIVYLYNELFNDNIEIHKMYNFLVNDISNNYSSKYNRIYEIIKLTN